MRSSARVGLFSVGLVVLVGCGGAAPAPETPVQVAARPDSVASTPAPQPLPTNAIRRSQVQAVLKAGPGAFLQRVTLDDKAVFHAGRFHGFRVAHLNDATLQGVDLKPGDVITHINGFPIEHPEEALEAFKSLEVSSELRVEYERDGVPRELRYAIVDDDGPAEPAAPAKTLAPEPKPAAKPLSPVK